MLKTILYTVLSIMLLEAGCYYDNYDELFPAATFNNKCDTTSVISYSKHISVILQNYCVNCHDVANAGGNIRLDNYNDVKTTASLGLLMSSVEWTGTAKQMPKGSSAKINNCNITQLKKWIDAGMPNN